MNWNDPTRLFMAAIKGDRKAVVKALADGVDPNQSLTPTEFADLIGSSDMLRIYKNGYDPKNRVGYYPLFWGLDNPAIVGLLLEAGADPNVKNALDGGTALHFLGEGRAHDGARVSAERLLDAGAEVNARNFKGETPLIRGCLRKADGGFLQLLLDRGASVGARDNDGDTALHLAGYWDEGYLAWPLDEYRENEEPVPASNFKPDVVDGVHYSVCPWGALEAVNALVDAGADPNDVNPQNGYTPMHWASVHHGPPYLCFVAALFERGGKIDIPNCAGIRPSDSYVFDEELWAWMKRQGMKSDAP